MDRTDANTNGQAPALPERLAAALPGRFLVFDGPDGSGKSTQLKRFAHACSRAGVEPREVREPGGTHVGERIREALLEHSDEEMSVRCEMLLYMASRAQLVEQRIVPALRSGQCVLADRFVSSTLAYQGTAGGLPREDILAAAEIATGGVRPDLVIIFDLDQDAAAQRLNPLLDRMEAKGRTFHQRVHQGYLDQVAESPERHLLIDASVDPDTVQRSLIAGLAERLPSLPRRGPVDGGAS
jgi:dTMP kinase